MKAYEDFIAVSYDNYRKPIEELFDEEWGFNFYYFPRESIEFIKGRKCFHKTLYELLKTYENFFNEKGLRERYLLVYCQIYYCFSLILKKWGTELDERNDKIGQEWSDQVKDWIRRKWLRICIESESNPDIKSIFEANLIDPKGKIDAEKQIDEMLFDRQELKSEFADQKWKSHLDIVSIWLLQRYNLKLAWGLSINMPISVIIRNIIIALMILYPPIIIFGFFRTIIFSLYALFVIFLFAVFVGRSILLLRILLPRLIAGIIIGYLPLFFNDTPWKILEKMLDDPRLGIITVVLALIFSFLYVFNEIYKTVKDIRIACGRTLLIYSMGLIESFAIGAVLLDIITQFFCIEANTIGLFGYICPKILYIYFPSALFIGFFTQMMWQEKPITYPI
jgi:hypothetical protein